MLSKLHQTVFMADVVSSPRFPGNHPALSHPMPRPLTMAFALWGELAEISQPPEYHISHGLIRYDVNGSVGYRCSDCEEAQGLTCVGHWLSLSIPSATQDLRALVSLKGGNDLIIFLETGSLLPECAILAVASKYWIRT